MWEPNPQAIRTAMVEILAAYQLDTQHEIN